MNVENFIIIISPAIYLVNKLDINFPCPVRNFMVVYIDISNGACNSGKPAVK